MGFQYPRIVDVGTGSGAIAVTLASKLPQAEITAIDISSEALDVANANAARNGVASRIRFQEGDLLAPIKAAGVEIVVSNPPYVATTDREAMAVEVREFEPTKALFAGEDGLAIYRRLIPAAQEKLTQGGWLAMEIGYGQAEAIARLLAAAGFAQVEFARDLAGIERVATARRMGELEEVK
jgi:release factor glutamine methyltransferase